MVVWQRVSRSVISIDSPTVTLLKKSFVDGWMDGWMDGWKIEGESMATKNGQNLIRDGNYFVPKNEQ